MESRENQIFEMFEGLRDYSQEPPSSVYKGIRKRMWWSGFMHFSAASLNVYYVGAILAAGLAAVVFSIPQEEATIKSVKERSNTEVEIDRGFTQQEIPVEEENIEQPVNSAVGYEYESVESSTASTEEIDEETVLATEEPTKIDEESTVKEVNPVVENAETNVESPRAEEMTEIENKEASPLPVIPYNKAVFSIHDDLMEQIKNPNKETITLTINEKRKIEEEK